MNAIIAHKNAFRQLATIGTAALILGAAAQVGAQSASQQGSQMNQQSQNLPEFSIIDRDRDQQLSEQELLIVAEIQGQSSESLISEYDNNQDDLLSEDEYSQLSQQQSAQQQNTTAQASGEQASGESGEQQRTQITVKQKPAQVVVDKPAPQITVKQAQPKVTVISKDPEVQVEQGKPEVSVNQPEPEVAVNQRKPEVDVESADPNVDVRRAEPQVSVEESEPAVDVVSQENQQQQSTEQSQQREQAQASAQTQQQDRTAQTQQQGKSQEIYSANLNDLRNAKLVDNTGQELGTVQEVVIKRDGSEAGLIVVPSEAANIDAEFVFTPVEGLLMEGDQLVIDNQNQGSLQNPQNFNPDEYQLAPESDQPLSDMVQNERVTQR